MGGEEEGINSQLHVPSALIRGEEKGGDSSSVAVKRKQANNDTGGGGSVVDRQHARER